MSTLSNVSADWVRHWQRAWDRLEDGYVPDREARIGALIDVVEAVTGDRPLVVDLGCGTGTVSLRLLSRLPRARVVAVDVDPVLLAVASATFANDDRVTVVNADLRDRAWASVLGETEVDAVVTATALHWLSETNVRRLYGEVARFIRPGGVFAHAEYMPAAHLPRLGAALAALERQRAATIRDDGRPTWDEWWELVSADPVLKAAAARRRDIFRTSYPVEEFSPPADWHISTLTDSGFAEAGVVWRAGAGAIVAAIRP